MGFSWNARRGRAARVTSPRSARFVPRVAGLEDRTVPATFFVDPALAGSASGATVTFNQGNAGQTTGLRYAPSAAFWAADSPANPGATYAFSDLRQAIDATELNPGPDTVRIAQSSGPIPLDNTAVATPVTGGTVNSVNITQPLALIGSGLGATVITPAADTQFDDGTGAVPDLFTSVFRVSNAGGTGASLTVNDLTFEGSGRLLGIGFAIQDGAAGVFERVNVQNVVFEPSGASEGIAIMGFSAAGLTVADSLVGGYGRVGVQFGNTSGSVTGSTVTGRGAGTFYNSGVDVYGASNVLVSGNVISQNRGQVGADLSSGVLAYADPDDPTRVANVTLIGNTLIANAYGIALGVSAGDGSTLTAEYNNLAGNDLGGFNNSGTTTPLAQNNWWGHPTGPFHPTANPGGQGDEVSDRVNFRPFLTHPTPVEVAATVAEYLSDITVIGVTVAPQAGQPDPVLEAPVRFTVTFARPVTGFDAGDVVATSDTGQTPVVAVSGGGAVYTVELSGASGFGTVSVGVVPRAAVTADGFLTTASNTVTLDINIPAIPAPPPTRLTAAGPDAGGGPFARVLNQDGGVRRTLTAFPAGTPGGVRTAVGDFNGDGVEDLAVGTGPGTLGLVRVLDGAGDQELFRVVPFEGFTGGVFVAAGDITRDGRAELVVTPDQSGGPRVSVFRGGDFVKTNDFFGIGDPGFRGGARAAVGDMDADGFGDLAVAAGFGGGPRVAVYGGRLLPTNGPVPLFHNIFVFEDVLRNGAYVAIGDLDGDGFGDLISGAGLGGGPRVFALSGADLVAGKANASRVLANFFGGDPNNRAGIRVAVKNLDEDARADLVVGPGAGSAVTAYSGLAVAAATQSGTQPTALWRTDVFPGFAGGVFVG